MSLRRKNTTLLRETIARIKRADRAANNARKIALRAEAAGDTLLARAAWSIYQDQMANLESAGGCLLRDAREVWNEVTARLYEANDTKGGEA